MQLNILLPLKINELNIYKRKKTLQEKGLF